MDPRCATPSEISIRVTKTAYKVSANLHYATQSRSDLEMQQIQKSTLEHI